MRPTPQQSWWLSALFYCSIIFPAPAFATDRIWSLLLHQWQGEPQIRSADFLLSAPHYSPEAERAKTLTLYQQDPTAAFCRFPARLTYLAAQQGFILPADRFARCPQLQQFLQQVPFDQLELVFASEVLSSASSMFGHIFIKASGRNSRGNPVAHSLAYFTEITSLNPIRLMVESTITGMPGFFSVRPFATDLRQYRDQEQRNLWQFKLRASADARQLLQLHIWELHQIKLSYLFQSFNCATLTLEMLALTAPELIDNRGWIVSPADVVKAVISQHRVISTEVAPARPWLFHALADSLPVASRRTLDEIQSVADVSAAAPEIIRHPLAASYLALQLEQAELQQRIDPASASAIRQALPAAAAIKLDLSHYKHPANTPQDGAAGAGWLHDQHGSALLLHWLSAGHLLQGDNRQYLAESELQIARASLLFDPARHQLRLHELTLYSAQALTPDTTAFPVWSGEFYLGYRPAANAAAERWSTGELSGAAGKSLRLHPDVIGYALAGGGLSTNLRDSRLFGYGKTGLLLDMAADTKLQLQYLTHSGMAGDDSAYQQWFTALSWFASQNQALTLQWQQLRFDRSAHHSVGLTYDWLF